MIKNILFDLGGVIYDIEPKRTQKALEALLGHELDITFVSKAKQEDLVSVYEMGKISTPDFLDLIRKEYDIKATDEQLADAWNALLIGVIPGRIQFLTQLKEHFHIALLSNTNDLHYQAIYHDCIHVYNLMEKCFFSYKMGMRKPNIDIFETTFITLGWKKEETIFVEDSPGNIKAAKEMNLPVFPIHNEEDFKEFMEWTVREKQRT